MRTETCPLDDISRGQSVISGRAGSVEGKREGCLQLVEGQVGGEEMERTSAGNSVMKLGYERQEGVESAVARGYLASCGGGGACVWVCVCVFQMEASLFRCQL